jgi:hypothetical protein
MKQPCDIVDKPAAKPLRALPMLRHPRTKPPGSVPILAAVAVVACSCVAAAKDEDVNAHIAKAPIAGLPPGMYSQWTEEQKKTAIKRVGGFCEFLCVDSYGNTSFPNKAAAERAKAEAKVCLAACIVNHLPADYPQLAQMKQDLRSDFEKARKLGSAIAWPLPGK